MHEASIAQGVIDSVTRLVAEGTVSGTIRSVRLRVGRLTAVVPDNLVFVFGVLAEGGPLAGVRLEIEDVPVGALCTACGTRFEMEDELRMACTACGSTDVTIETGRELLIHSVEVD
jgi:hydrogenase nickel incorporation protein HypA/HybF